VITGRPGFAFDEARVRRAGLDHWSHLKLEQHNRFTDFCRNSGAARILPVTKVGTHSALEFAYRPGDILLFGNETAGLPPKLLKLLPTSLAIPMIGPVRSLNLSNAVAIVAYAYMRSVYPAFSHRAEEYPRTYYKRAP